jgi:Uma2 family endonuclease
MSMAVQRHRFTRQEYERLVDSGGFGPEARVELLDGELWDMTPQGSRHAVACELIVRAMIRLFGDEAAVRGQSPIALDDVSAPEPDIAVMRGSTRQHVGTHPSDALLLIEVADSSLAHDRGRKLAAYARNGVPEYWIVDLTATRLEVYRDPAGESYGSTRILDASDRIEPLYGPGPSVAVGDLLP